MFERFTDQARQAVTFAMAEARERGTSQIECEHLLLGLARSPSGGASEALAAAGVDVARLRDLAPTSPETDHLDGEALAHLGIDLDEVRRTAEAAFGPGALDRPARRKAGLSRGRMSGNARHAIELGLRAARRDHSGSFSSGHLLIGLIDEGDNGATRLLAAADVDLASLRADAARRAAAPA